MYCIFIYSPNGRNIFKIVLRKFSQKSLCWTLLFSKLTYTCSAESLIIASWARKMWLNWDLSKSFLLKGWETGGPFNLPINYKKVPLIDSAMTLPTDWYSAESLMKNVLKKQKWITQRRRSDSACWIIHWGVRLCRDQRSTMFTCGRPKNCLCMPLLDFKGNV